MKRDEVAVSGGRTAQRSEYAALHFWLSLIP